MLNFDSQKQSFDQIAELYDTVRPRYPQVVIDKIIRESGIEKNESILEIGSGTGIATLPFARLGFPMVCVEPGESLVAVAERKLAGYPKVSFVKRPFETYPTAPNQFKLIISAQAFHWIDPAIGYPKCVQLLTQGGHIAFFWSRVENDNSALLQAINDAYKNIAPELTDHIDQTDTRRRQGLQAGFEEIKQTNLFQNLTLTEHFWQQAYSCDQYINLLASFSDHRELSDDKRHSLFTAVRAIINDFGGTVEKPYVTALYMAQRKDNI